MADPKGKGGWGPVRPPPPPLLLDFFFFFFFFFFYKNEVYEQKVLCSIKRVGNLSQNAGNGHSRDSNFQKLALPPPPLKVLVPLEISHVQQFFNLDISGCV